MNVIRFAFVCVCVLFCLEIFSYAQLNSQNAVDQNTVKNVRPTAEDFANEITGVVGDPGKRPDSIKRSQEVIRTSKKVKFYMASWCPYCKRMEKFLNESHIPYEKFDVEKNAEGAKAYKKLMGRGVPMIVVDQTVIRGYDPAATKAAWDEWNKRS